jgi:heat shock protein HslJ
MRYVIISLLVLAAAFGANAQGLDGVEWRLTGVGNQQIESSDILLNFDSQQNMVSGVSECNEFSGYFRLSDGSLQINQSATTNNICDDMSIMQREDQFFVALHSAKTYAVYGNNLVLFNDMGQKIASFVGDGEKNYSNNSLNKNDFSKKHEKDEFLLLTLLD